MMGDPAFRMFDRFFDSATASSLSGPWALVLILALVLLAPVLALLVTAIIGHLGGVHRAS